MLGPLAASRQIRVGLATASNPIVFDLGSRVESELDGGGWVVPFLGDSRVGVSDGAVFLWQNLATITSMGDACNKTPNNQPTIGTISGFQGVEFDGTVGAETDFLFTPASFDASAYDSCAIVSLIQRPGPTGVDMAVAAFGSSSGANVPLLQWLNAGRPRMLWKWGSLGTEFSTRTATIVSDTSADILSGTLDTTIGSPQMTIRWAGADISLLTGGSAVTQKMGTHPFNIGNAGLLGAGFTGTMGFVALMFKVGAIDAAAQTALVNAETLVRTDFGVI